MKIGFHVSISGGIDKSVIRAKELEINTFQIFTRNPRMWKARELRTEEIENFKDNALKFDISPVFSHMPYLPNFATPVDEIYEKSKKALETEINNCNQLEIPYIVTHLGSHLGSGSDAGINRVTEAINDVTDKFNKTPIILLENTSGKTNEIGSTFEELSIIMDGLNIENGICLDTCHAFTQGYNIKSKKGLDQVLNQFEKFIGWKKLRLIHLNDSRGEMGSKIDRHQHIGLGEIGEEGFTNILNSRIRSKPIIMETPVDEVRKDIDNLRMVRELLDMSK
ncbi:deoxyribonuclease IV [Candidatus Bathyarchaeota archaeon]|nr:deoxyribonuclease IV [Candidatus Bathyarchaeota archaeon]